MEFHEWVKSLIDQHQNPVVKYDVQKDKYFRPANTDEEKQSLEARLEALKRIVCSVRVERRCSRSKLNWLPDEDLCKVAHFTGSKMSFMGYQNKSGRFVFPEEAFFLLETNRAEITLNSIPLTINQSISLLLKTRDDLNKYRIYRNLALRGCDIRRREHADKKSLKQLKNAKRDEANPEFEPKLREQFYFDPKTKKKSHAAPFNPRKRFKGDLEGECAINFDEIFADLRKKGPQVNDVWVEKECDYKFNLQCVGKPEFDWKLHFMPLNEELDPKIGFYKGNCNVYGSLYDSDIVLTKFVSSTTKNLDHINS